MIRSTLITVSAAVMLLTCGPAAAGEIGIEVEFSDMEISAIRAYYRAQPSPGRSKKGGKGNKGLPPGIAKNLKRGKPLPPGIAKRALPAGLADLLPAPPHGFERIIVAGKILLVEAATQVIHDILEDVILD